MALSRVWVPSPNYSGGSTKRLIVLHTTEGFTGPNGAYDCAIYFKGNVGASSQVCIDNNRGTIYECVSRSNGAWTQCNYNSVSVSAEQCGYASWSRSYWLNEKENLLRNTADWIAEEAKKFGIPIVKLSASQAQSGGRGICYHSELGSAGCGHSDPGSNYPIDQVIAWAKGEEEESTEMSVGVASDPEGNLHYATIRASDGALMYYPPGWSNWGRIDENQKGAKGGAGIAITDDWWVTLTYHNSSGQACQYRKKFREGNWVWSSIGDL